jgi:hypothetical protein
MGITGAAMAAAPFSSNIMMDLPTTNYRDLPSVEWLVETRKNTDGTMVLTVLTLNIMDDIDNRNHH